MSIAARERLRILARRMAGLSFALACIIPPLVLIAVFKALEQSGDADIFNGVAVDPSGIGTAAKAGIYALNSALALALSRALWRLQESFRHLGADAPKLDDAAAAMAASGRWFLIVAIGGVFVRTASVVLATLHLPAGERLLSIGIGQPELFGVLVAGTLLALGHVVALAASLDAENREFV
ncbi:MAG: hypothetical protein MUC58_00755 [Rhizobiaceae bacterium]|jgi:hypothetical protein|nr:hypothetical protein [Rhizobiaceae bacterium]